MPGLPPFQYTALLKYTRLNAYYSQVISKLCANVNQDVVLCVDVEHMCLINMCMFLAVWAKSKMAVSYFLGIGFLHCIII
jgi:hypothetical protein